MIRHLIALLSVVLLLTASCRMQTDRIDALPYRTSRDGRWGLMGTDGTPLVPAGQFELPPTPAVNGMFSLPDSDGMYQLYRAGQPDRPVSTRRFARIGHFFEKVTLAQETPQSPILIIDKQGNIVASSRQYPQYDIALAHNFSDGRALFATREGKYGYIDTQGKIIVPPLYDRAYDFYDGVALVGITNPQGATGYQLIDRNGKAVLPIQLNNCRLSTRFSRKRLMYKDLTTLQCGYLDRRGMAVICLSPDILEAYDYEHDMALFQTATGTGVIDGEGNIGVPAHFENIIVAAKDRIAVRSNGQWAVAKSNGTLLCRPEYNSIGHYYSNGLAVARKDGAYLFIDRKGRPVGTQTFTDLTESAEANRSVPQRFIRQNEPPTDATEQSDSSEPTTAADVARRPAAEAKHQPKRVPRQSTIQSNDWRKIGRQNPFYEEARKVVSGKLEETDAARRTLILNYMEHLRTSYNTKDIDFLEQLFSENALIVVGTVVKTTAETVDNYLPPTQVVYNIRSKSQYIEQLKRLFQANRTIDVTFGNFHIMRHPTMPGIYGVSLRQGYSSDIYSDDGYLFLLWDFRDEAAPKIHVRTWQPSLTDDRTPLPEEEILNIRNFNLQ